MTSPGPAGPAGPTGLDVAILGPLLVRADGADVVVSSRRQRALLVLLALDVGRVVSADRLVDQLWDGDAPPQAMVTLRSYVSHLRASLGGRTAGGSVLATRGQGYVLDLPPERVDAVRLQQLTEAGRELLRSAHPDDALHAFQDALALWRGQPLSEIADHEAAASSLTRLEELHLGAQEGRFEALLATGRHLDAVPELEAFTADHPLREAPRAQLMLALHRAGRAPDALEVHRRFRALLRDELGIDPSPHLDRLTQQILEQDPDLDAPAPAATTVARTAAPSSAAGRRPLFGRAREQARVARHLTRLAQQGTGGLVLVAGEPGIGKTALLESVHADATGAGLAVHAGRVSAAAGAPPFWPWTQVLESLADRLDDAALAQATAGPARLVSALAPGIAARTGGGGPDLGEANPALKFAVYDAVTTFLGRAAERGPLVVTLDDVHQADLSTLEVLSYLTPVLASRPVLVVAAYRDLAADRTAALEATLATVSKEEGVEEVRLTGLDLDGVAALAATVAGDVGGTRAPLPADLVALLHERTAGNPFFVRQLGLLPLDDAGPDGHRTEVGETGTAVPVGIPPGVRHVIASRLAHLPAAALAVLEAASLLGREFDVTTVASALGLDVADALTASDEAVRHGLLEESDVRPQSYRFSHALVQEVVVSGLTSSREASLHAALAEELESGAAPVEEVAEHFWRARGLLGRRALPHLLAAADKALAVVAHDVAERQLRRALDLVRSATPHDPATELNVLLRLFRLIATDRGWGDDDARAVVERARDLAALGGLHGDAVRLWWSLWMFLLGREDPDSTEEVALALDRAVAGAQPTDATLAARAAAEVMLTFVDLRHDRVAQAHERLDRAQAAVESAPPEEVAAFDEHLHVMVLLVRAGCAALQQDAAGHRRAAEAAVALADADGRPFPRAVARTLAAFSAPFAGDAGYAGALAGEAIEITRRLGYGWLAGIAAGVDAWARIRSGEPVEEHLLTLTDLVTSFRELRAAGNVPIALYLLADAEAARGRVEVARELLRESAAAPGAYERLMVDRVGRRLAELDGQLDAT